MSGGLARPCSKRSARCDEPRMGSLVAAILPLARLAPKAVGSNGSSLSRACHPHDSGEGTRLTLDSAASGLEQHRAESQAPGDEMLHIDDDDDVASSLLDVHKGPMISNEH